MPDRPQNKLTKLISEEAAEWLLRLREGGLSNADRLEYVRWLKQSPAHVRAVLELASLESLLRHSDLAGIPPTPDQSVPSEAVSTVVDLILRTDREETPSEERR